MLILLLYALAFSFSVSFSQHIQHQLNSAGPDGLDGPLFLLHKNLVNLESISGNEQSVGEFLEAYLISHNYTVERQYVDPLPKASQGLRAEKRDQQRFNILAYPGEARQTLVLLTSHIDTVPPYYSYSREHDYIWGRGSVDAKACVVGEYCQI